MNCCTFAGRLGRDAEVRHTQSGQSVTGFAIAVDEYAGKGERRTLWVASDFDAIRDALIARLMGATIWSKAA